MKAKKELIKVDNLTKNFDDLLVLDSISFNIFENEFLSIVGPTGCGKTTFCNLLSRLIPATKGSITLNGQEVNPRVHNISFVFQEASTIPWRTVERDIAVGLEIRHVPKEEIKQKVHAMIDMIGLKGFEEFYPVHLSEGLRQRVAIARAFITDPDLLLMDEPFGQLDTSARIDLEQSLVELWQKRPQTIIFVTHNIEEAVYLAERIIVMTNKPTTIKETISITLPRPRNFDSPDFVEIRQTITDLVRWW